MSNLLSNGSNSLLAFQRALTTTSHNISNVNTDGYSRQRVELQAAVPERHRNGFIGNGVRVSNVERLSDQFATSRVLQSTSVHEQHNTHHILATRLDNLVADNSLSLTPAFNDFFSSVQDANANPSSAASRGVLVSNASHLASRFQSLQNQLDNAQLEVNERTVAAVTDINELANGIAELNERITSIRGNPQSALPNDILDQRDLLLSRLAAQVDINTLEQENGAVNVYTGNGIGLVVDNQSQALRTSRGSATTERLQIEYSHGNTWINVTNRLQGGALGGLKDFENQTLIPGMNQLGQLALSFGNAVNQQHALGIDLNGNPGLDLFSVSDPTTVSSTNNTGNADVSATFADISLIQASEYSLRFTGSDYVVTRLADGEQTIGALPISLDGMDISITGTPVAGDTFTLSPTRRAAASFESLITDTESLALSSPIRTTTDLGNLSNARIADPTITNINDPQFGTAIDMVFVSDSAFNIVDAATGAVLANNVAYSSTVPIQYNGWEVTITGNPVTGDKFSALPNATARGNNSNGIAIANIQSANTINGVSTFNDAYASMVSRIGGQTRTLQTRSDALNNIRLDSIERQQSVSGVNLDEEAINLTRYEQAYQASAQVIATADTLFQTILGALRR